MNSMTISFYILGILAIPLVLFAILVVVYTYITKKYSIKFDGDKVIRVNVGYKVWDVMSHKDAFMAPPVNIVYSKITKK